MRIVVDQYPDNCETCKFKTDNFSSRKNHCNLLHIDIGGVNDVRYNHICYKEFVTFDELLNGQKVINKEEDNIHIKDILKDIDEFSGKTTKRDEEEIKKQREEALSKTGFLDTGNTVSIGEELRKIKDEVLKMDRNYNGSLSEIEDKKSEPTDYSKIQADEMRCEAFGGLV